MITVERNMDASYLTFLRMKCYISKSNMAAEDS